MLNLGRLRPYQLTFDRFWETFFVDATSIETISSSLKEIAKTVHLDEDTNDVLEWLASQNRRWLILFDNADDPKIDLSTYFPRCTTGDILITTKNNQMIVHANGKKPHCRVQEMEHEEAKTLLLARAELEDSEGTKKDIDDLLQACSDVFVTELYTKD